MPRPPYEPASWHSSSRLTFWLSICNTGLPLSRGSKIKRPCPDELNNSAFPCWHVLQSRFRLSSDIVICRSIICHFLFWSMLYWRGQSRKWFIISYNHLNITGRQGPSERRSRPRLRERNGARRSSGGKDSPNGAYRSEGPCRHNMSTFLWFQKYKWSGFWGHKDLKIIIKS